MKHLLVEHCKGKCKFFDACLETMEADTLVYEEEEIYQLYQCMFEIERTA